MTKEMIFNCNDHETRIAILDSGMLSNIYIERREEGGTIGNIYNGRVVRVLPGIQAAFVDIGLERTAFLYVADIANILDDLEFLDEEEADTDDIFDLRRRLYRRDNALHIEDVIKEGQEILVQVAKEPLGNKGARLTTHISLPGRNLVYMPTINHVGISRRIHDEAERQRLRDIIEKMRPDKHGFIARTVSEGKKEEELRSDLEYLTRLWANIQAQKNRTPTPGLVHAEIGIILRAIRDFYTKDVSRIVVDSKEAYAQITDFMKTFLPNSNYYLELYDKEEPIFHTFGIELDIVRALNKKVWLKSGGYIVIETTEALCAIDVNTGKYVGKRNLEETILNTNLEAVKEIAYQLRLRNIGGIIIIDFIDMAHTRNRELVLATLEAELETDRTKTYVVELSPLGLVEMTRQNTTDGARGILTRSCPVCSGKGRVLSEETMALSVERRVRALARKSQAKAWLIEVNGGVADRLSGARLKHLEKLTGRRVFLEGAAALPVESFRVVSEGSLAHVQDQRIPVREGQEVTVELEFSLTYSPRDAVGYVDGYMIIVEGGRQHLGKRRRVRITETARTGARATVLKGSAAEAN